MSNVIKKFKKILKSWASLELGQIL
jgi:hypothetical protein